MLQQFKSLVDPPSHGDLDESMDSSTTSPLMDDSRMPARPRTTCDSSSTEWGEYACVVLSEAKGSFNDQEIVALSGAHAMGRCHTGELYL